MIKSGAKLGLLAIWAQILILQKFFYLRLGKDLYDKYIRELIEIRFCEHRPFDKFIIHNTDNILILETDCYMSESHPFYSTCEYNKLSIDGPWIMYEYEPGCFNKMYDLEPNECEIFEKNLIDLKEAREYFLVCGIRGRIVRMTVYIRIIEILFLRRKGDKVFYETIDKCPFSWHNPEISYESPIFVHGSKECRLLATETYTADPSLRVFPDELRTADGDAEEDGAGYGKDPGEDYENPFEDYEVDSDYDDDDAGIDYDFS
jgi:hypothetical protein